MQMKIFKHLKAQPGVYVSRLQLVLEMYGNRDGYKNKSKAIDLALDGVSLICEANGYEYHRRYGGSIMVRRRVVGKTAKQVKMIKAKTPRSVSPKTKNAYTPKTPEPLVEAQMLFVHQPLPHTSGRFYGSAKPRYGK